MPTVRIEPNQNLRPRYRVPDSGVIRFTLESDIPLQTYIVRPAGLEYFDEGSRSFKYSGGFPDARRKQSQTLRLPFEGHWHLLIINRSDEDFATVDYSVYYE
jgi:hypothetical protein